MKKKRLINGLLLICLLIIWSFVVKKIFFNTKEPLLLASDNTEVYEAPQNNITQKKTITLTTLINPFTLKFDIHQRVRNTQNSVVEPRKRSTVKKETTKPWPSISYYGFVGKGNQTNLKGLLKIDKKTTRLREGENVDGLRVKKLYADSVIIIKDGKEKSIIRN